MPAKIKHNIGQIVNTNKILKEFKKGNRIYYEVECVLCNTVREVRADNLKQQCKSCAAKKRIQMKPQTHPGTISDDLTGKKFGYWKVLYKASKNNYWHCLCTNCKIIEKDVFRGSLTSGESKSCGCVKSYGEQQLISLFHKYNISFQKEYIFPQLITQRGGHPRFDFAIIKNNKLILLIEYNGRQHYTYDQNWNMTKQDFDYLQKTDKIKQQFCKQKNIPLLIFNQENNLEQQLQKIIKNFL